MVRILVADDEQDLAWAIRRSLSNDGYEVLCAYNGAEALALALRVGASLLEAAVIANAAAGVVVGKVGTATASVEELRALLPAAIAAAGEPR